MLSRYATSSPCNAVISASAAALITVVLPVCDHVEPVRSKCDSPPVTVSWYASIASPPSADGVGVTVFVGVGDGDTLIVGVTVGVNVAVGVAVGVTVGVGDGAIVGFHLSFRYVCS